MGVVDGPESAVIGSDSDATVRIRRTVEETERVVRGEVNERPILSTVESPSGGVGKWIFRLVLAAVVVGIIYGVATGWLS
jgi:hypothetical protein